jgi:hypothetical protein
VNARRILGRAPTFHPEPGYQPGPGRGNKRAAVTEVTEVTEATAGSYESGLRSAFSAWVTISPLIAFSQFDIIIGS